MSTYMPSDLINSNYTYYLNNNYYVVRTNNNCYNNYNTQYCDCVDVFPMLDYSRSNAYSCSTSYSHTINYDSFTSDYWYRLDIDKILVIFIILAIVIIIVPYKIISRWFGRWLKV